MHRNFNRIAFFWVGADTTIPSLLVKSIRANFGSGIEVVQLSGRDTPEVEGVSAYRKQKLSPEMMVARLEAYSSLTISEPTLFLDADMLVLREFNLPPLARDEVGVTTRDDTNTIINWRFPVEFPEFQGKRFIDEMPYVYSFVYSSSEIIFVRQLVRLRRLPKRFRTWYGDQVTLKKELDAGPLRKREFDVTVYNRTVRNALELQQIMQSEAKPCLLHFKGIASKKLMVEASAHILSPGQDG